MPVLLRNPEAPATARQLFRLHKLTGEDMRDADSTMQQASDKIEEYESGKVEEEPIFDSKAPFTEAHVCMIEADQGGGKSLTATGMVTDTYFRDCVRIYCEENNIRGIVKGYDHKNRIARLKVDGVTKFIRIPKSYKLHSPMRIFANFHFYGIPYVYIPSFGHLLAWLKAGIIVNGWLVLDEYYIGGNARDSMTAFGKELEKQGFQMRKMQLDVILITPIASLIDKYARLTPTKHILCSYDKKRREVTLTIREKGKRGSRVLPPFDATQYWPFYWTNERINK